MLSVCPISLFLSYMLLFTCLPDPLNIFHQRPQTIPVPHHYHSLPFLHLWYYFLLPIWKHSVTRILQALDHYHFSYLCQRKFLSRNMRVSRIINWVPFVTRVKDKGRCVIAPSPKLSLFLAMFFDCFDFIESFQGSVVSFIHPPVFDDGYIVAVELISSIIKCLNCSCEERSEAEIKLESILLQNSSGLYSLLDALVRSTLPLADSLTSVQPVNRFCLFQVL